MQLFGIAQPIAGPRNPGEFDMRAYQARADIHHAFVVGQAENGKMVFDGAQGYSRKIDAERMLDKVLSTTDLQVIHNLLEILKSNLRDPYCIDDVLEIIEALERVQANVGRKS